MVQPPWKPVWRVLKELNPETSVLGTHPKETESRHRCVRRPLVAAVFAVAKTWKQPERVLMEEWILKK